MLDQKSGIAFLQTPNMSCLPASLDRAVNGWKLFCSLSQEEKYSFGLNQFETNWSDPGYRRKTTDAGFDNKEYFHVTSVVEVLLNMTGVDMRDVSPVASHFLSNALILQRHVTNLVTSSNFHSFCSDRELENKILELIRISRELIVVRLLKYVPNTEGSVIAGVHTDKSGISIHLYSSHPGLQYTESGASLSTPSDVVWHDLTVPSGSMGVFGGYQAEVFSEGNIRALVHQVVQPVSVEARYSVVAFIPFLGVKRFPKEKRVQDLMKELGY